jgi:hypothetical protein
MGSGAGGPAGGRLVIAVIAVIGCGWVSCLALRVRCQDGVTAGLGELTVVVVTVAGGLVLVEYKSRVGEGRAALRQAVARTKLQVRSWGEAGVAWRVAPGGGYGIGQWLGRVMRTITMIK